MKVVVVVVVDASAAAAAVCRSYLCLRSRVNYFFPRCYHSALALVMQVIITFLPWCFHHHVVFIVLSKLFIICLLVL